MLSLTNNPLVNYFKEAREELGKVTWPSRRDTVNHTVLVVAITLFVAVFFGILDFALNLGLEALLALRR